MGSLRLIVYSLLQVLFHLEENRKKNIDTDGLYFLSKINYVLQLVAQDLLLFKKKKGGVNTHLIDILLYVESCDT